MAKLPARQKVTLLLFRRVGPDEILLVPREVKRILRWSLPSTEVEDGASARDAAAALAPTLVDGEPLGVTDLGMPTTFRVNAGPHAGEWTERYVAVEAPADTRPREGQWFTHYEAKAESDAPRVRDAITRLREVARLKP